VDTVSTGHASAMKVGLNDILIIVHEKCLRTSPKIQIYANNTNTICQQCTSFSHVLIEVHSMCFGAYAAASHTLCSHDNFCGF